MTDDERELLIELTGTIEVILHSGQFERTLRDFERIVKPIYSRLVREHFVWDRDAKHWVRRRR